jgi:hypothetical protein
MDMNEYGVGADDARMYDEQILNSVEEDDDGKVTTIAAAVRLKLEKTLK